MAQAKASFLTEPPDLATASPTDGKNGGDIVVLLGTAILFFILTLFSFQRHNITVGAWPWQRPQVS